MDLEREIRTQRLRLLRIIAGLLVAVGFSSIGPVSRSFSDWVSEYVASILSRAELAVRYLVIAQARLIVARRGIALDFSRVLEGHPLALSGPEEAVSVADCRARLRSLQAVLSDLPRHALRLLRRIEKQARRSSCADRPSTRFDALLSAVRGDWRLAENRIERPPDIGLLAGLVPSPPFRLRTGGALGWVG